MALEFSQVLGFISVLSFSAILGFSVRVGLQAQQCPGISKHTPFKSSGALLWGCLLQLFGRNCTCNVVQS